MKIPLQIRRAVEIEIQNAFRGVTLGQGVSLRRAQFIDGFRDSTWKAHSASIADVEITNDWPRVPLEPISGMSMNPARTFGSAINAGYWHALWIYFVAPTLGMVAAAEIFLRARGNTAPCCGKLHHGNKKRCIFRHHSMAGVGSV